MSETSYAVDLMIQVREHIREHPEQHDQKTWGQRHNCHTTHCIAGWAVVLAGDTVDWQNWGTDAGATDIVTPDGHLVDIEERATELLRLSWYETDDLFHEMDNAAALDLLDRMIEAGRNGERVRISGP